MGIHIIEFLERKGLRFIELNPKVLMQKGISYKFGSFLCLDTLPEPVLPKH